MSDVHIPVLAGELVEILNPRPGDVVVDCTFGAGGHAQLFGGRIGTTGELICVDRDPYTEARFEEFERAAECETQFLRMDYAEALAELAREGVRADLIYMDLGVSSMQVDNRERGFSYAYDAPLDMRMDPSQDLSADEVVNRWPERRLAAIFKTYGEERYAGRIARAICADRERRPFTTTGELVNTIKRAVPMPAQFGGGHPARRVFQAIRIAVNGELDSLERGLAHGWEVLKVGGAFGVIAFHSLEDRIVKRFFADRARGCICPPDLPVCVCGRTPEAEILTRRAVAPTAGEVANNPRAKSARLRAVRKLREETEQGS